MKRRAFALCSLLLYASLNAAAHGATVRTKHVRVQYRHSKRFAERVARWATEARADVLALLGLPPKPDEKTLAIVLQEQKVTFPRREACGQAAVYALDGGRYSRWRHSASLRRDLDPFGVPLMRAAVRQVVTRALLHQYLDLLPTRKEPHWLVEGLVAHMASDTHGLDPVTKRVYFMPLVHACETGTLMPARELSTQSAAQLAGLSSSARQRVQAQCWSWVRFLLEAKDRSYRQAFLAYLRQGGDGELRIQDHAVTALEPAWQAYVRALMQTPLRTAPVTGKTLACAGTTPLQVVERFLEETTALDKDERHRHVQLAFAGASQDLAPPMRLGLRNADRRVRAMAAHALGLLGDRTELPGLVQLALRDPSGNVRRQAARAVGRLNYQAAPEAFLQAMESKDLSTVKRAATALGETGDPSAVDPVIRRITYWFRATNFPRVWFRHTTSRTYVRTYQLAPAGTDLEAVLDTVEEGVLLQHKVLVAEGAYTITEVVDALALLAPEAEAESAKDWAAWYNETLRQR